MTRASINEWTPFWPIKSSHSLCNKLSVIQLGDVPLFILTYITQMNFIPLKDEVFLINFNGKKASTMHNYDFRSEIYSGRIHLIFLKKNISTIKDYILFDANE